MVLYRVEEKAVQKIRIFSPDCELDAGGRTIHWLDGVKGSRTRSRCSPRFVAHDEQKGSADRRGGRRDRDAPRSVGGCDARALRRADQPEFLRKKVPSGWATPADVEATTSSCEWPRTIPSDEVRKSAMFALSQSREPEALTSLIQFAQAGSQPEGAWRRASSGCLRGPVSAPRRKSPRRSSEIRTPT